MKFGIGVLGATGYIGTPYRREIREASGDSRIVAVCGRRLDLLQAAGIEDGADLVTTRWREVVEHPEVNLVVICTPDALHYEEVMACVEQRKHVVCEKPIGMNIAQARAMWSAVREAGVGHFVPFWTRYVPVCIRARQLVKAGRLGELRSIVCRWHNPRPPSMPLTWRDNAELSSAGSIADVGSHVYDTLRWITGQEATRALAMAKVLAPPKPDLIDGSRVLGVPVLNNDFTLIEGVGPRIAQLLVDRGITTWWALANSDVELLRSVLREAGPKFQVHDPRSWPQQARLLAFGEWEKFLTLAAALRYGHPSR
mgnify:CR=1 FL=1